jgi:hypothetical protein
MSVVPECLSGDCYNTLDAAIVLGALFVVPSLNQLPLHGKLGMWPLVANIQSLVCLAWCVCVVSTPRASSCTYCRLQGAGGLYRSAPREQHRANQRSEPGRSACNGDRRAWPCMYGGWQRWEGSSSRCRRNCEHQPQHPPTHYRMVECLLQVPVEHHCNTIRCD